MAHIYEHREYPSPALWHDQYEGSVPHDHPVIGGHDINGEPIYIGRARHSGDTIPGKIVPSHRCCYVSHAGGEHAHHSYQCLVNPHNNDLVWIPAQSGDIPSGAIQGGQQSDGTRLYIGRAYHNGSMVIGKVHPEHNVLYIPFDGDEVSIHSYEVLVLKNLHVRPY